MMKSRNTDPAGERCNQLKFNEAFGRSIRKMVFTGVSPDELRRQRHTVVPAHRR